MFSSNSLLSGAMEQRSGFFSNFRVFYEVFQGENAVWVLAIGLKEHNRLFVQGEEFEP